MSTVGLLFESASQYGHREGDAAAHEGEAYKNPYDTSLGGMPRQQNGGELEQHEADEQSHNHGKQGDGERSYSDLLPSVPLF